VTEVADATVRRREDVPAVPMAGVGVRAGVKRVLVSPSEGWDGHVMRLFEIGPGGHTPRHTHDWPHINVVVAGHGVLHVDGVDHDIEPGSSAFVPSGATHQFSNAGDEVLQLVCIVPEHGEY
jgi:quercetin dioxygenase-like cupin family protein